MNKWEKTTVECVKDGASTALELFNSDISVRTKKHDLDYVTNADINAQSDIVSTIRNEFPNSNIVREENSNTKTTNNGNYWVVDPIDGTSNFVAGNPFWATSVAVVKEDRVKAAATAAPALSELYQAGDDGAFRNNNPIAVSDKKNVRNFTVASILRYGDEMDTTFAELLKHSLINFGDLRRFGSAQLTLAMVGYGALDACIAIQPDPNPWDTIAGVNIVRKAGGKVTDIAGNNWSLDSNGLVATNGNCHEEVIDRLQELW